MECIVPECPRKLYARGYCNAHYIAMRKHPTETPEQLAERSRRHDEGRTDDEMRALLLANFVAALRVPELGECHEWTGASDKHGYGNIRWHDRLWGAHRLAFHLFVHPVGRGMSVCHRCDNPPCIRREHLFYGTHHQNMLDAASKGRMAGNGR